MRLTEPQFDATVKQHRAMLDGMAHRMTGNCQDAEDLVAETLVDLWRDFDADKGASFMTFATRVMTGTWANTLTTRNRMKRKAPGSVVSLDKTFLSYGDKKQETTFTFADTLAAPTDEYDIYEPETKKRRTPKAGTLLSRCELGVLRLMATGKSAEQIADELFVSARTVQFHQSRIYRRFGMPVTNGGKNHWVLAVIKGVQQGLITIDTIE